MSNEILKIKDLHVVYDTDDEVVFAVNGLDLSIKPGETMGLVGETGAGKTTTALSILRLLPEQIGFITKGSIELDGVDILMTSDAKMRALRGNAVSMIFQDPMTSLNPTHTVGEQVAEALYLHRKHLSENEIEQRVDELFRLVGLQPERKHEYPHQFSGGMKQRIVIAIALACQPKLLLADEPTTALDVTIQAQVLLLMRELKEKLNTAMLMITHDLGVVAQICDTVAIMYAGEIVEKGTIDDVFESKNHHPYTAGLFGAIPDLTKNTKRLNPIHGLTPDPTNIPSGCPFHPRCSKRMEICTTNEPITATEGTHMIKCHLFIKRGEKNGYTVD